MGGKGQGEKGEKAPTAVKSKGKDKGCAFPTAFKSKGTGKMGKEKGWEKGWEKGENGEKGEKGKKGGEGKKGEKGEKGKGKGEKGEKGRLCKHLWETGGDARALLKSVQRLYELAGPSDANALLARLQREIEQQHMQVASSSNSSSISTSQQVANSNSSRRRNTSQQAASSSNSSRRDASHEEGFVPGSFLWLL